MVAISIECMMVRSPLRIPRSPRILEGAIAGAEPFPPEVVREPRTTDRTVDTDAETFAQPLQKPNPAVLCTTTPPRRSCPTSNCTVPSIGMDRNTPMPTPSSNGPRTAPTFQTAPVS